MKYLFLVVILLFEFNLNAQPWVQKATMPGGTGLDAPIYFSIGSKLYVGGGYTGSSALNTFYEYTPSTNSWAQKANIPSIIYSAASFSLNGKGYIVSGKTTNLVSTVFKYDPTTNTWQTMNSFLGTSRQNTVGFNAGGKGYVFGGYIGGSSVVNDLWQYNDTTDTWTQMASCPGPGRDGPAALVINNQIFVGLGGDVSAVSIYSDFYNFNPLTNSYTQVASAPIGMDGAANFTVGNLGYVGIGYTTGGNNSQFYIYNATANTWTQTNNFGRYGSFNVFCATVGNLPYVGCGIGLGSAYVIDNWTWVDTCHLSISLGNDTTLCNGSSLILTDTNTNVHHFWNTGATTGSITVTTSGAYWLVDTTGNCTATDTIHVTFTSSPAPFNLGNDTTYCGNFSRVLSTGNAATTWSTGATGAQITVTAPGKYWATISNNCGSVSDTIVIHQNLLPVVNLGGDTNICNTNPITLNASSPGATYLWQNGTTNAMLTVSSSGVYWVAVTANGCTADDSIVVSYISVHTFNIGNDTTYCGNFSRVLTAGVAHTVWSTGDTSTSITVNNAGVYSAYAIACGDTLLDTITITDKPIPVVELGNDTSVCPGSEVILNAGNAGATYLWQDGSHAQTYTATSAGVYWAQVTVNGCTGADSVTIASLLPPTAFSIGSDTSICEDSTITLNAFQSGCIYFWSNGDTATSIIVSQAGQYTVIDSNACGSAKASANINVHACSCKIAIPTAFSPNDDGKNDFFYIITQCPLQNFQFDIYNRWGQKIFNTDILTDKWDGTYKGVQQPLGVYVYFLHYTDPYSGKDISRSGNVTLTR